MDVISGYGSNLKCNMKHNGPHIEARQRVEIRTLKGHKLYTICDRLLVIFHINRDLSASSWFLFEHMLADIVFVCIVMVNYNSLCSKC